MDNIEKVEQVQEAEKQKKQSHLLLIIIIIILLLSALCSFFIVKAKYSKKTEDADIVKIMNSSYKLYEEEIGKATDEHDAHNYMSSRGFVLEDLVLSKEGRQVVWDSVNDCFALMEDGKIIYTPAENSGTGYDLWIYTREVPESSDFSIFWCGTETVTIQEVVGQDEEGQDILEDKDIYYYDHDYTKTVESDCITYECPECGHKYSVKCN